MSKPDASEANGFQRHVILQSACCQQLRRQAITQSCSQLKSASMGDTRRGARGKRNGAAQVQKEMLAQWRDRTADIGLNTEA